jgi:hypothetical protein
MRVLGCALEAGTLRGVVAERAGNRTSIHAFLEHDVHEGDVSGALRALIARAGTSEVAWALSPPDVAITRLAAPEHVPGRERTKMARLRAEALGFAPGDAVRVVESRARVAYLAAARRGALAALATICRDAGARLAFVDHEAYAWSAVMPARAQALVLVDAHAVRLVVLGAEQVQLGIFAWEQDGAPIDAAAIAASIADAFIEASKVGFADVDVVAAQDPQDRIASLLRVKLAVGTVVPFALAVDPARTAWALACGVASRAVRGGGRRLAINLAERRSELAALVSTTARVDVGDLGVVALGVIVALGLVGWRAESLRELRGRALAAENRLSSVRVAAAEFDRLTRQVALARSIVITVDATRRSGPLAARELAAISSRIRPGVSATSLTADPSGWNLAGHARAYGEIAQLVGSLAAGGYAPSVSATSPSSGRLGYALVLRRGMPK